MRSTSAILASVVLATLTLTVFARSQLQGPEGSIHRYFLAILDKNVKGAAEVSVGSRDEFVSVTNYFAWLLTRGEGYRVVDVMRAGGSARAGVIVYTPDGREQPFIIPLRRIGKTWKIDLEKFAQPRRFIQDGAE